MKIIYFIAFIGIVSADKLAHSYFPAPASARTAGGFGQHLVAPSSHGQQQHYSSGNLNKILRNDFHSDGVGNYDYAYQTDNGIAHNEEGHVQFEADKIVKGSYSYTGDDGKVYTVNYYADANGFHASGDHLPGNNAGYIGVGAKPNKPLSNRPANQRPSQRPSSQRPSQRPSGNKQLNGYPYPKPSTGYLPVL